MLIRLALYAKDPDAAPVKTRLAAGLGAAGATEFYRRSLALTLARLAPLAGEVEPVVMLEPASSCGDFGERFGWPHAVLPQPAGDLGVRLVAAFDGAAAGAMVAGTDMPELGPEHVLAGRDAVAQGELALGACPDGGYYLLGAHRLHPRLFEDMPWSTPALADATRARARELGLAIRELPPVPDIDYLEDLQALDARLGGAGELGAMVREVLAGAPPPPEVP